MIINHINLTVSNVVEAADFLETYFDLHNRSGDEKFTVLFDDNGMVVSLMKAGQVAYPRTFHIGFMQETEEQVNKLNQRLKEAGFDVKPPQRQHAWTFYILAPGGFTVEVLC